MNKFRCPRCKWHALTDKGAGDEVNCGWCRGLVAVEEETPFTESDWLSGTDADLLLQFARRHASDRKMWLFCYACSRLALERTLAAVDAAERSPADEGLRAKAYRAAWFVDDVKGFLNGGSDDRAHQGKLTPAGIASVIWGPSTRDVDEAAVAEQAALLRDVVGNPFRPVKLRPALLKWNGGTIPKLAQAIDEGRTFADLPVLADALEEAGCGDESVLAHCRGAGPHVRGCWVIDLILGRK
jgi:hypothetical protein